MAGWRVLFWVAAVAGVVLALWPASPDADPWFAHADKLGHAIFFALLVVLAHCAGYRSWRQLMIGLLLLGAGIEVAQSFTPTRTAEWGDWLADALGVAVGFGLMALIALFARLSGSQPQEDGR